MPQTTRGRLMILFLGQLLFTASFSVDLTLTGIVGYQLTPDKTLATLPYSLITLVACLTTFGASILAAADNAPEATRARNIATVLSGGVIASILGPFLAYLGDGLIPDIPHAGAYLTIAALALLSAFLMLSLKEYPADTPS